jgi:hypothetical protein
MARAPVLEKMEEGDGFGEDGGGSWLECGARKQRGVFKPLTLKKSRR